MKLFKLWVHQQNFSEDELIINPKEFPNENVGDILEIHHPDEDNTRLLLQIKSISPDFQQKDTISIEQSVANVFQLRTYWDVEVTKVEPKDVSVDLVELLFKDQFVSRSEMWRFSKQLVGSCVYVTKKISRSGVRAQVNEIWTKGEKLSCGVISENTRVVFRSCSTKMYLFIQMSKEMWDFDFNGDLYIEKAINGFLYELFTKWKELKANHDVNIILFSRTFYDAQSPGDFPVETQACIQQDPYGRFYEDFYQVVVLQDRRDDWIPMLVTLKRCFNQYPRFTNCCDRLRGTKITGWNSSSCEGNFLEAINLSMNAFERHHIDRNFERTGQTTILVTPGSGVFEVDREMTSITKQRLLDSGVSVDLVCLAEQPLHTIPLLKFFNKTLGHGDPDLGDDYNIPHWMNHNFYTSPKNRNKTENSVPRIKIPDVVLSSLGRNGECEKGVYANFADHFKTEIEDSQLPDLVDYDEYDRKVFRNPITHSTLKGYPPRGSAFRRIRSALEMQRMAKSISRDELMFQKVSSPSRGVSSFEDLDLEISSSSSSFMRRDAPFKELENSTRVLSSSVECTSHGVLVSLPENVTRNDTFHEIIRPITQRFAVGSAGAAHDMNTVQVRPQRTLINPFKPNAIPCNWTCNNHRWSHVFPKGPSGKVLHLHYEQPSPAETETLVKPEKSRDVEEAALAVVTARKREISEASQSISEEQDLFDEMSGSEGSAEDTDEENTLNSQTLPRSHFSPVSHGLQTSQNTTPRRRTQLARINLYRGVEKAPVEHDWTAAVKTGVDWKSLTCPALLPLTSDFYPNKKTLNSDYLEYNYKLYIEEEEDFTEEKKNFDWGKQESTQEEDLHGAHRRLSAEMIFIELVSQRIRKGFQLIPPKAKPAPPDKPQSIAAIPAKSDYQEYFMSIGRISHKLSLTSPEVTVTKYRPRHQLGSQPTNYSYRLWIPQRKMFEPNQGRFLREEMDNYNWNYLDQHICGDPEFDELIESLNYWKARFLLLPFSPFSQRKMKEEGWGDKKNTSSQEDSVVDGILRFLEVLNRIKRLQPQKVPQTPKERKQSEASLSSRRISKQHEHKTARPLSSELTVAKDNNSTPGSPLAIRSRSSSATEEEFAGPDTRGSPSRELASEQPKTMDESEKERLSVESPLESVAEAMLDPGKGLTFLPELKGLKPSSFLSVEAISWILQNVDGVNSKEQAIQLCQKMVEAGFIQHASESAKQTLVEGFIIFCFTPKSSWVEKTEDILDTSKFRAPHRSSIDVERFEVDLLRAFQMEWFEIAIWPRKTSEEVPEFLAPDQVIDSFPTSSPYRKRNRTRSARRSQRGRLHSDSDCGCGPAYKFVTLDADPHHKSQRPETCTVRYHGNYCALHAFEIELHWIAATGCIVNDMVHSWTRKAPSCGFHLVPVPVSPFPDPVGRNVDPFRLPVFIPLNFSNCTADGCGLFEDFDPSTRSLRMFLFLEDILQRFGFIRDSPYGSMHVSSPMVQVTPVQCRANDYVHTSGVAFVRILNLDEEEDPFTIGLSRLEVEQPSSGCWGFHWMHNYMLTRRWRSAATGDSEAANTLRGELEDFCADKNGALKTFWESCREPARKAFQKRAGEEDKPERKKNDEKRCELNKNGDDSPDVEDSESSTLTPDSQTTPDTDIQNLWS